MRTKVLAIVTLTAILYCAYHLYSSCILRNMYVEGDVGILLEQLYSPRACMRSKAAFDLQKVRTAGKPAVNRLVELLSDQEPSVRWRSVTALGDIGYYTEEVKDNIYKALDDPNEIVRYNAIYSMSLMGLEYYPSSENSYTPVANYKVSDKGFSAFLKGLKDRTDKVVYKALIHLDASQINNSGASFRNDFISQLKILTSKEDYSVRSMALILLGQLVGVDEARPKKLE